MLNAGTEYKKKPYIHKIAETTVKWKKRPGNAPMLLGYARISTSDQNNQRQIDELVRYGVHRSDIFQETMTRKTLGRPAWKALYRDLQQDDILVIYSFEHLARNLGNLIEIEKLLFETGVRLTVIAQDIDTSNASGLLIFNVLDALAQWKREWK